MKRKIHKNLPETISGGRKSTNRARKIEQEQRGRDGMSDKCLVGMAEGKDGGTQQELGLGRAGMPIGKDGLISSGHQPAGGCKVNRCFSLLEMRKRL